MTNFQRQSQHLTILHFEGDVLLARVVCEMIIVQNGAREETHGRADLSAYFAAPLTQPSQSHVPLVQVQESAESQVL